MTPREATRLSKLMREELERAMRKMRIPRHPRPYFMSYLIRHEDEHRIEAKFGGLTTNFHEVRRHAYADVRVGSYRRDQIRNGGLRDNATDLESYELLRMPVSGNADGLRHALWRLTEAKYREAIDDLLHRQAVELNYLDEHAHLPALQRRKKPAQARVGENLGEFDRKSWCNFAIKASAVMKRFKLLRDGHVRVNAVDLTRVFVSSEGSTIIETTPFRTVEVHIWFLSPQGFSFPQSHTWFVTTSDELPTVAEVRRVVSKLCGRAELLAKAPLLRSFAGPVLLDPQPAGLLIHEAIGHRLEGNRLLSPGEGQTFRDSVDSEVLPQGLSVYDDPRLTTWAGPTGERSLVGAYQFDDEGTPAKRADLIEDGVLKGYLTSRAPIGKRHQSNGHARAAYHQRPISRMGVTVVEAKYGLDDEQLFRTFVEEIREQEVPFGIRIMQAYGGETSTDSYNFQAFLGDVDFACRVFPDGRQELVRGVDFVGTPLNAVRGIIAAGNAHAVDNSFCGAESGYIPVSTISPALLVDMLELQSKPQRAMTQYAYPMPWEK